MKYSQRDLLQLPGHHLHFDAPVAFSPELFRDTPRLTRLDDVRAEGDGEYDSQMQRLELHLHVTGRMTCPSDVTGKAVTFPFDSEADETISFNTQDAGDYEILSVEGSELDLVPVIFRQILLEIPIKIKEEGPIDYPKGDGWEVMDEATYEKQRASRIDPRLAALKDYKPQDE
jgi:uncharacterized protein